MPVRRDAWGVPHVHADDELTLAHAQGLVTAQDRTWQLRLLRAQVAGQSAALLGEAGVPWDVLAHRVRLTGTAQRAYAALADDDRAWVDAYAAGVRDGLAAAGPTAEERELDRVLGERDDPHARAADTPPLPADRSIQPVPADGSPHRAPADAPPHPLPADRSIQPVPDDDLWPSWASLGALHAYHVLFSTFPRVLWHAHVVRTVRDAPAGSPLAGVDPMRLVELFAPSDAGATSGSNAWAVHGSRTASGRPLLGGDPHRLLDLPGTYQQVGLACPAYDVIGLAFVGVPGVPHFGHTGAAAWGITNAMAHSAEVVRERLRRDGAEGWRALGPAGWEPVERGVGRVDVRGGAAVEVEVLETARGPLVVRGLPVRRPARPGRAGPGDDEPGDEDAYALRHAARVDGELGVATARRLLHARTAADVHDAFAGWVDPVNRVVAADVHGTVLAFDAGRVADRPPVQRWLPLVAWDPAHAPRPWRTLAAPTVVTGVHVDANERPADPARAHGSVYAPDRADRLRTLLADRTDLRPDTVHDLHADAHLAEADRLLGHVARADGLPQRAAALRERLLAWDRCMEPDDPDAGAYAAVRAVLARRLAAEPVLAALDAPHGLDPLIAPSVTVPGRVATVVPALLGAADLGIDGPAHVRAALVEVADGADPGPWGARHTVLPAHVLDDVPGALAPAVPQLPLGGDQDAVRCTGSVPGVTDRAYRGSVARWVWDLADRDRSRWGVPFGTSGDPGGGHLADQHLTWSRARTLPVVDGVSTAHWARLPGGTVVDEREVDGLGVLTTSVLDLDADLSTLHAWCTARGTGSWGLGHLSRDELRAVYAHVAALDHHHALMVRVDGERVALAQAYEPVHDPVAAVYDVLPGDIGLHVLVGARPPGPPRGAAVTPRLVAAVLRVLGDRTGATRAVGEPDVGNVAMLRVLANLGAHAGPRVELPGPAAGTPGKQARLVLLDLASLDLASRLDRPGAGAARPPA